MNHDEGEHQMSTLTKWEGIENVQKSSTCCMDSQKNIFFHEICIYKLQPLYIVNSIVQQSRNYTTTLFQLL